MVDEILDKLGQGETLCQLAEEAAELSKAALKYRRALGYTDNVTPVTAKEAYNNLIEEIADVRLCLLVLGLDAGLPAIEASKVMNAKVERWHKRIFEKEEKNKCHLRNKTRFWQRMKQCFKRGTTRA